MSITLLPAGAGQDKSEAAVSTDLLRWPLDSAAPNTTMSTIDSISALESLGNNNNITIDLDLFELWQLQHGRQRQLRRRPPSGANDGNNNNNNSNNNNNNNSSRSSNMNNLFLLPPPPPLSFHFHHPTARINSDPNASATRSAMVSANNNVWNVQAPLLLSRWRDNDIHAEAYNGNGDSNLRVPSATTTTTTALTSTFPSAAIATAAAAATSAGRGFASLSLSSSVLVPYTTSSSSYTPIRTMDRIGDQRLRPYENYSDNRHQHHSHFYHRMRQQYHQQHLQRMEQQQHLAVAAHAEEQVAAAVAANAMVAVDSGLERLQLILDSIRGNNYAQLNVNVGATASARMAVPSLGIDTLVHLAMGGVDDDVVAEDILEGHDGNDISHASTLPIHEEINSSAAVEELGDGQNDSPSAHHVATTSTVAGDMITNNFSPIAAPPTGSCVALPTAGRPVRQAAMRGMERISAAIATHGRGGGGGMAYSPSAVATTTRTIRLSTRNASSSGGGKKKQKKATVIHGLGTTNHNNDDGSRSNKMNTTYASAHTSTPTSPVDKKEGSKPSAVPSPPICCICLEEPSNDELSSIDSCTHPFCFSCIEKWADQENTCPLCKAKFYKIDRVNTISRKRKDIDSESEEKGGEEPRHDKEEERSSKRVRNRDQRSNVHRYSSLESIFEGLESNGTWPTHIAQLLFSGLGASSRVSDRNTSGIDRSTLPAGAGARPTRRYMTAVSTAHGQSYHRRRAAADTDNDLLDLAQWYEPTGVRTGVASYLATSRNSSSAPSSYLTGSDHGWGGQYHREGLRSPATSPSTATTTTAAAATTTPPTTSTSISSGIVDPGARDRIAHPSSPEWHPTGGGASTFAAIATAATPPTHSNSFTSFETFSPWPASPSFHAILGPGGFEEESSSTRTTAYQHPSAPTAAMDVWGSNSFLTSEEEEEEMLSTMSALSPSAYIRRLHCELELEQGQGGTHSQQRQDRLGRQYRVNTSRPSSQEGVSSTSSGSTPHSTHFHCVQSQDNQHSNRPSQQYQFNTFWRGAATAHRCPTSIPPPATTTATNPFNSLSAASYRVGASSDFVQRNRRHNMYPWNNAAGWNEAGRTVETALEIADSDDDDVVEIIDVEALP